ncbi:Putative archaetidylserine decarboxylase proenzyme [uncultured archaeon]|nr:Putative archaetidylserine decarboxylase proenzyme [uncultured archaeon]
MWLLIVAIVIVALILFYIHFNRDPDREIPKTGIVSPADGKVLEAATVKSGKGYARFAKGMLPATMIRIFLSLFDVHVQRAPIEGIVKEIKYFPGRKLFAFSDNAWENEHAEITIKSEIGLVKVVLIAGILARRIRVFAKKGQKLQKGQRIGRILLGSQVILILPKCKTKTKRGQRVQAGTSIIA